MEIATATAHGEVGDLLRDWRRQRRISQFDLGLEAGVSARHLSFVETGRAQPSRDLLLRLAEFLNIPLRERNRLLLAGGFAPVYRETPLDEETMAPVRDALAHVLTGLEPFPALVVDNHWELVLANRTADAVLAENVAPHLLTPPANMMRLGLHPDGFAPRILNFGEYSSRLLIRLRRQAAVAPDPVLSTLIEELRGYPGVEDAESTALDPSSLLFVPLRFRRRSDDQVLSFFSTLATFGIATDITLEEMWIESFFPADEDTRAAVRAIPA